MDIQFKKTNNHYPFDVYFRFGGVDCRGTINNDVDITLFFSNDSTIWKAKQYVKFTFPNWGDEQVQAFIDQLFHGGVVRRAEIEVVQIVQDYKKECQARANEQVKENRERAREEREQAIRDGVTNLLVENRALRAELAQLQRGKEEQERQQNELFITAPRAAQIAKDKIAPRANDTPKFSTIKRMLSDCLHTPKNDMGKIIQGKAHWFPLSTVARVLADYKSDLFEDGLPYSFDDWIFSLQGVTDDMLKPKPRKELCNKR